MAGERTKLVVVQREKLGSSESRRMRKEGLVPGVLYGNGEPVAICIAERELRRALTGSAGLHAILDVEIDGKDKTHASILKEYQVDPIRGGVTHERDLPGADEGLQLAPARHELRRVAGRGERRAVHGPAAAVAVSGPGRELGNALLHRVRGVGERREWIRAQFAGRHFQQAMHVLLAGELFRRRQ